MRKGRSIFQSRFGDDSSSDEGGGIVTSGGISEGEREREVERLVAEISKRKGLSSSAGGVSAQGSAGARSPPQIQSPLTPIMEEKHPHSQSSSSGWSVFGKKKKEKKGGDGVVKDDSFSAEVPGSTNSTPHGSLRKKTLAKRQPVHTLDSNITGGNLSAATITSTIPPVPPLPKVVGRPVLPEVVAAEGGKKKKGILKMPVVEDSGEAVAVPVSDGGGVVVIKKEDDVPTTAPVAVVKEEKKEKEGGRFKRMFGFGGSGGSKKDKEKKVKK